MQKQFRTELGKKDFLKGEFYRISERLNEFFDLSDR